MYQLLNPKNTNSLRSTKNDIIYKISCLSPIGFTVRIRQTKTLLAVWHNDFDLTFFLQYHSKIQLL